MKFVILDLEWSASYSKKTKGFVNEIIEFGAVKLDEGLEIIDRFSMLVTPQIGKKLNSRVGELTGLSFGELEAAGNTFMHALKLFSKFVGDDSVIMTWSNSDIIALCDNIYYYTGDKRLGFMKRYCNVQRYCEEMLGTHEKAKQMGLSACCELLGIEHDESRHHRADTDAEVTAMCFKRVYDYEKLKPFIHEVNDAFYRRIEFRTHYLTSMSYHLVNVGGLHFECPECKAGLKRKSVWSLKNHSFRATEVCPSCQREYMASVSYKAKYDGVDVSQKVKEIIKSKEQLQDAENA